MNNLDIEELELNEVTNTSAVPNIPGNHINITNISNQEELELILNKYLTGDDIDGVT